MRVIARAPIGRRHAYGDVAPTALMVLQGGTQAFSIAGVPIDRHAFVNKADDAATSAMTLEHLLLGPIRPAPTDNAIKGALNLGV